MYIYCVVWLLILFFILQPGSNLVRYGTTSTPGGSKKKAAFGEDVINKSWDCVRTSNGIMVSKSLQTTHVL